MLIELVDIMVLIYYFMIDVKIIFFTQILKDGELAREVPGIYSDLTLSLNSIKQMVLT